MNQAQDKSINAEIQRLLKAHHLPDSYRKTIDRAIIPLAKEIAQRHSQGRPPLFVAINGSQGSGKSTLTDFLACVLKKQHGLTVANLSLDDFYLTRAQRQQLAQTVHPLLATRGVPGTHDISLLKQVLQDLKKLSTQEHYAVPQFDKATDDRKDIEDWQDLQGKIDIILLEGWCVGAPPQSLDRLDNPINQLEAEEDPQGLWRRFANEQLSGDYARLFDEFDYLIMLKAPSFDCVYTWRLLQERKLAQANKTKSDVAATAIMDEAQVERFIQHYQRVTEHCLSTLPSKADALFELEEDQSIHSVTIG